MIKRFVFVLAVMLALLAASLALWPVPIDPVAWKPPPPPELTGPLAPNDGLTAARRILEGIGVGPEDIAFDCEGRLYTGFEEGLILRTPAWADDPELFVDTGGRPLGMVFDAAHGLSGACPMSKTLNALSRNRRVPSSMSSPLCS